jgi:hypothetical protein
VPWEMADSGCSYCHGLHWLSAITAGNYDATDQWRPPTVVLRDVLLPALRGE